MKSSYWNVKFTYGLLILFFCWLAYVNSFRNIDFLIDDWDMIFNNPHLNHPKYLLYEFFPNLKSKSTGPVDYYRPLLETTIAISYWICGFNVLGYHIINWILFSFACLSVYVLVDRYFKISLWP